MNIISLVLYSQNLTEGEGNLEQEAVGLFKEKKFSEALPKFSQLVSLYPKDPNYNFAYGVCLIETNTNTTKGIDYLNFAASKSSNPVIFFYLGKAYHYNYKFDEALQNFGSFKNKASPTDLKEYDVDKYISMCKNGKDLVRYISDLIVLDNKKIKLDKFYYSYELSDFGGKLLIKPPEFRTKLDDKFNVSPLMFLSDSGYVYFANYDKKTKSVDIFRAAKQTDGTWGIHENLGTDINTIYDEDYPFIHPDGKTLYFSSKGHNTMGGFDVFRSIYDSTANKWGNPQNLDFPTNSPYNDFLFISDKNEDFAYFASNRETNGDKISVYKIEIDKNPLEKENIDLFEILHKSKLEVTPLADVQEKHNRDNASKNTNQYDQNTSNRNELAYNFDNLKYNSNLTINDILKEANKDVEKIETDINNTKTESDIAFTIADKKNKEADKKRIEAEKIKQSNPKKAEELNNEANRLDKEAVLAFNLAKNLNNSAEEKKNDAEDSKQFIENVKNTGTDPEKITEELNNNREYLDNGYNKYITVDKEIENRQKLAIEKENALKNAKNELLATQSDIRDNESQINEIETRIKNSKDKDEIAVLNNDKIELQNDLKELNKTAVIEKNKVEKLSIEKENTNNEIAILTQLKEDITNKKNSNEDIASVAETINKEELEKDIFDKEFIADKNLADNINDATNNTDLIDKTDNTDNTNNNDVADNTESNLTHNNVEANENNSTSIEKNNSSNQIQSDKEIVDSLRYVISIKNNELEKTTDANKKETLNKEIKELQELVALKDKNLNNQVVDLNNNYNYENFQNDLIDKNPVYTFNTDDNYNSKTKQYEKEKFNSIYYSNLKQEQEKKLAIMNSNYEKTTDEEIKNKLQKDIKQLEKLISYSDRAAKESNQLAETIKKDIPSYINEKELTSDALLAKATEYQPKNKIEFSKVEEETIGFTQQDRVFGDKALEKWIQKEQEIDDLEKKLNNTDKQSDKTKIQNEINKQNEKSEIEFLTFDKAYKEANKEEFDIYKDALDKNRIINESENSTLASNLEKDANIYFEKASLIRENADLIDNKDDKRNELIKAKNYELIAINNQKHALDLYSEESEIQESNNLAEIKNTNNNNNNNNNNNEVVENTTNNETRAITLLPEEEDQLKQYRKENHLAETLEEKSLKDLNEIKQRRAQADETYNTKDKNKLLKGIDEEEKIAKDNLEKAHIAYAKSDSLKYSLYKDKLTDLSSTLEEVGNNNKISKQYMNEADFYYTQASKLRNEAKTTSDQDKRIELYKKALKFEEQAMANQEIAVDILMEVDQIEFASMNNLVKIDRLESINKPVNVDNVAKVDSKDIILKLNLPEEDLKALDDATKIKKTIAELTNEADSLEKKIEELKQENATTDDPKVQKANNKEITKLEEKMFANRFGASELSESVNNTKYWIYKDNFNANRTKGNSEEARQGRQLEKDANTNFNKAKSLRDKSFLTEKADLAYKFLTEAKELEEKAIEDQEAAYGLYLNIEAKQPELMAENNTDVWDNNLVKRNNADVTEVDPLKYANTDTNVTDNNLVDNTDNNDNSENTDLNDKTENTDVTENTDNNDTNENNDIADNTDNNDNSENTDVNDKTENTDVTDNTDNNNTNDNNDVADNTDNYDNSENTDVNDKTENTDVTDNTDNNNTNDNNDVADNTNNNDNSENTDVNDKTENTDLTDNTDNNNTNDNNDVADNTDNNDNSENTDVNDKTENTDVTDNTDNNNTNDNNDIAENNNNTETTETRVAPTNNVLNFSVEPVSRYSASNPIPINEKLPEGIVFKVQIGAFKQEIKQDAFKGLNPITGEKIEGSQFTRYLVGLFKSFEGARTAQSDVSKIGYRDAFVVAYKDGKRIPLYEARNLLKSGEYMNEADYNALADAEVKSVSNRTADITSNNVKTTNNSNVEDVSDATAVKGSDIKKINGLLYTVQIGVYKQAISHSKLYNINPIYEEKTEYGFTRYTTGIFDDKNIANIEKDRIVKLGIEDAFVAAYFNGKRISMSEAKNIEESNDDDIFADTDPVKMAEVNTNNTQPDLGNLDNINIVFKVQIGAYKEQVPTEAVSDFIRIAANNKLDQHRDENGTTIYSVGNFTTYQQATQTKTILINQGLKDAFVVAYNGDKKIPVSEAIRLLQ